MGPLLSPSGSSRPQRGHVKRASFGRMSMEQRESERERIRADHSVDMRLFLEREYRLGEGRNAEVYLGAYRRVQPGEDPNADVEWDLCAVKRMQVDRESQLAGFDEVFALRRLGSHPHIVNLVAVMDEVNLRAAPPQPTLLAPPSGPPDLPRLLILLEYLPFSLAQFVKREPQTVHLQQWMEWALQLTSTIEWLHTRGCVHADVKMQNVLLTADLQVKLCDFTSVLFSNAAVPATDCRAVGTPAYSAPELFTSSRWNPSEGQDPAHPALSYPLDIFSLGVLLYSLATGVEPSRRVHSLLAMRHRQHLFFQSEEDDRIERMSLPEMEDECQQSPLLFQGEHPPARSASQCSDRSVHVSPIGIERLLDPAPLPHGVISRRMQAPKDVASILRTKSLSATDKHAYHQRSASSQTRNALDVPRRPAGLERAASSSAAAARAKMRDAMQELLPPTEVPPNPPQPTPLTTRRTYNAQAHHWSQAYADGAPALILPGGGRMPDAVRALIQEMVSPIPEERPSAAQVRERLTALRSEL